MIVNLLSQVAAGRRQLQVFDNATCVLRYTCPGVFLVPFLLPSRISNLDRTILALAPVSIAFNKPMTIAQVLQ